MANNMVLSALEIKQMMVTLKYFEGLKKEELQKEVIDIFEIKHLKEEIKHFRQRLNIAKNKKKG